MRYEIEIGEQLRQALVRREEGQFVVALDGVEYRVDAGRVDAQTLSLIIDGVSYEVTLTPDSVSGQLSVGVNGVAVLVALNTRRRTSGKDGAKAGSGPQRVVAPMPGKVVRVLAQVGDAVQPRQPLVVVEAMKMENELRASRAGVVTEVLAREKQSVDAGTLLMVVAPA